MTIKEANIKLDEISKIISDLPDKKSKSKNPVIQNKYIDIEDEAIAKSRQLMSSLEMLKLNSDISLIDHIDNLISGCQLVIADPYKAKKRCV
ncbi:hypothetical protein [Ancylomarina longa]|uniref:Uncharacterized protein n=1 Tax=Ancylomarina longa TaxID=2487017 RepID=A0A434AWQ3_9BACT|nr:hypothetical protein [Ancylomarina longa]RUT78945.1 hypothetical protein DLK05_05540 [Ancylomarina longa]